MNDTVSFQSKGLIDPRCITTMGISVKESSSPIGQFGTGLKYAIAIVLREGGAVSIWRGLEELKFERREVSVRGKAVELVCMNGQELAFTTHLGSHWKMWQAFREIYCNTLDEGGEHAPGEYQPIEGATTVIVRLASFAECARQIGDLVLSGKPIYSCEEAEFHPGPSRTVYYRGIKVGEWMSDLPHRFAVNVKSQLTLTEDRTIKAWSDVASAVARSVVRSRDRDFIKKFIGAGDRFAEHTVDLDWYNEPTEEFMEVACRLAERSEQVNFTAMKVYKKHAPAPRPLEAELLPHEHKALADAVKFCRSLGYTVDDYPIMVVDTLGPNVLAQANRDLKEIWLARDAFKTSERGLASTLLEEWVHIRLDLDDESRRLQTWLFDELMRYGQAYLDLKDGKQ